MMKYVGSFFVIAPISVLIALSYFVLVVNKKEEAGNLKAFGYAVAVVLLLAAALLFSAGSYKFLTGKSMMPCMKHEMMKERGMQKHGPTAPGKPGEVEHR